MAIYKQVYSFQEEYWGTITITFMISDLYEGLFQSTTNLVSFFILQETNKEISNEYGLVEHELTFIVDEAAIKTIIDQDALTLLKRARNIDEKIFCAVFINTTDPPDPNDADFIGIVQPEWEADDLQWHGGLYTSSPNIVRKWKIRARPFANAIFDKITLKELIGGSEDNLVPGIDQNWININVQDQEGYFKFNDGTFLRAIKVKNLVRFDKLLRKLTDNFVLGLQNRFGITLNIVFDVFIIDGQFYPARWRHDERNLPSGNLDHPSFKIFFDDGRDLIIDPDNIIGSNYFYISFQNIKLYESSEPQPERAKSMLWGERVKTFNELIYRLAENFGAFPLFSFDNPQQLRISFVSKQNVISSNYVYIIGATSGKLKGKVNENAKSMIFSRAAPFALDGPESYYIKRGYFNDNPQIFENYEFDRNSSLIDNSKELLLTIAPTKCSFDIIDKPFVGFNGARIFAYPHNSIYTVNGELVGLWFLNAYGLHTGIYIRVSKRNDHYPGYEPDFYATPVGWFKIVLPDDSEFSTGSLTDYINMLNQNEKQLYFINYELDIPFYYGFSNNPDGSNASWKAITIGKKILIDNATYVIEGITRKLSEPLVTLKLQAFAKYDFDNNVSTTGELIYQFIEEKLPEIQLDKYIAAELIPAFNYVSLDNNGKAINSKESITHRSKYVGIALNEAPINEEVIVQRGGTVENENWNFTPGAKIFIKKHHTANLNLSEQPDINPRPAHEMYVIIGIAETNTKIRLFDTPEEYTMIE